MTIELELPKIAGLYDVTVRDRTIFTAYYNPQSGHWINPDNHTEIGFRDRIIPIGSNHEQTIIKIAEPLKN